MKFVISTHSPYYHGCLYIKLVSTHSPFLHPSKKNKTATIEPETDQRVGVYFQKLMIGPIKVNFKSYNYLDTTYLDQTLRISRGGRGNLFVLIRDDVASQSSNSK